MEPVSLSFSPSLSGRQRADLRGPMHRVGSQQLLVDSVVHGRESSSVIGDPDARHVAAFCVSTSARTSRERSIEWRIWQTSRERERERDKTEQPYTNPDERVRHRSRLCKRPDIADNATIYPAFLVDFQNLRRNFRIFAHPVKLFPDSSSTV